MRHFHFVLALLLGSANILVAQIDGYVYLYEDNVQVPAPNAAVYWEGTSTGTTTDDKGYFSLEKVPGHNTLIASFTGYQNLSKVIISRKGSTNFVLIPESTELEGVTVTGEALATQVNAKAAGLHFEINNKELRKAACCNLSESFETNASIDVSFNDGITGTKQIEMLGLAGKYALIQRENIPFARGLNAQNGLSYVPGPFIESIQVTKGLSSVLNGYESITGQINVEYYKPENAPRLLINAFGNTGGRNEINALIRDSWSDAAKAHNLTMLHFSSVPYAQDRNGDQFADLTIGRQFNAMHRIHYKLNPNWEGQFGLSLVDDLREGGQMSALENVDPFGWGFSSREKRYGFFGKNGYIFPDEEIRSIGIIYNGSYQERNSSYGNRGTKLHQGNFYLNTILQDYIGNLEHQFKTGISLNVDQVSEQLYLIGRDSSLYQHQRNEVVPGAYFEYSYEPVDDFSLVAGIRTDYNSFFDKLYFSPRLQARYQLNPNTTFRLSGGRGQRSPNRLAESSSALASSRDLQFVDNYRFPEIAWNAGFSWSQNIILGDNVLRWNTDLFYTWFESKLVMDLDYDPLKAYILNRSGSQSWSLLSQMDYSLGKNFDIRLAYKYLNSQENFLEGLDLSYQIPVHRAFLNLAYATEKEWKFDATLNWFGKKRQPNTSLSPTEFQQLDWSPDYFTVNLQVNKVWRRFEFFAGVDNLLNYKQENPIVNPQQAFSNYFDSNFVWGPIFGRNIYAGLYYRLP